MRLSDTPVPAGDLGNSGTAPWWVTVGAVITTAIPFLYQAWQNKRRGPHAKPQGLNAPVVATAAAKENSAPGVNGIQLTAMIATVGEFAERIAHLESEVDRLTRKDSERQWAFDFAINLYVTSTDPAPRVVPLPLREFMSKPPGEPA